jgi:hypothetical protein
MWFFPCPKETPFFAVGNHRINLGILVGPILSRSDLASNSKFVLGKVDILSAVDHIKPWGEMTGTELKWWKLVSKISIKFFRHEVGRWVLCSSIGIGRGTKVWSVEGAEA